MTAQSEAMLDIPALDPFIVSEEVGDLAADVLHSFDEFRDLAEAVDESRVVITYVFETRPFDPAKEDYKPHTIAKVTKAPPLWQALALTDCVVQFRETFWRLFTPATRRAVLFHEFSHVGLDFNDKTGRTKVVLAEHDIEEFAGVMRHFGTAIPGRKAFINAYMEWAQENGAQLLITEPADQAPAEAVSVGDAISAAVGDLAERIATLPVEAQSTVHTVVAGIAGEQSGQRLRKAAEDFVLGTVGRDDGIDKVSITHRPSGGGPAKTVTVDKSTAARIRARRDLPASEPCPYPSCDQLAEHDGDHTPPAV